MPLRNIDTTIWLHERFDELSVEGKLLYLYLITAPTSNIAGLYRLNFRDIASHTRIPIDKLQGLFEQLDAMKIVYYADRRIVWVKKSLCRQAHNPSVFRAAVHNLGEIPDLDIIQEFVAYNARRLGDNFLDICMQEPRLNEPIITLQIAPSPDTKPDNRAEGLSTVSPTPPSMDTKDNDGQSQDQKGVYRLVGVDGVHPVDGGPSPSHTAQDCLDYWHKHFDTGLTLWDLEPLVNQGSADLLYAALEKSKVLGQLSWPFVRNTYRQLIRTAPQTPPDESR